MIVRFIDTAGNQLASNEWEHGVGFPGQSGGHERVIIGGRTWSVIETCWVLSDPETNISVPFVTVTLREKQ